MSACGSSGEPRQVGPRADGGKWVLGQRATHGPGASFSQNQAEFISLRITDEDETGRSDRLICAVSGLLRRPPDPLQPARLPTPGSRTRPRPDEHDSSPTSAPAPSGNTAVDRPGIDDRGTGLRSLGSDAIRSVVLGPTRIALRGRIVLVVNDITPEGGQSQWIAAIDGRPESTRYALRSFRSRPTCPPCRPSHCTPDRPSRCGPILPVRVPMPHCSAGRADACL